MNEELATALIELRASFEDTGYTGRRRARDEAPWNLTSSYLHLMTAYGLARVGAAARAKESTTAAFEQLGEQVADPVHASLTECFVARVEQAIDARSRFASLPEAVVARREALDRVAMYKVNRLWEVSWILDPGVHREVAMDVFSSHKPLERRVGMFDGTDADQRAEAIARELEEAATIERSAAHQRMAGSVDALVDLPEQLAMPILVRAIELVDALPDAPSTLHASVLTAIGQFGWGELIPQVLPACIAQLPSEPVEVLAASLASTIQVLRRLAAHDAVAELVAALEPRLDKLQFNIDGTNDAAAKCWLALTGALSLLDDPRGATHMRTAEQRLESSITLTRKLEITRTFVTMYSLSAIPTAIAGIERLRAAHVRNITDAFGTNSHYCISVLDFAESLIRGLSEARIGRGPP